LSATPQTRAEFWQTKFASTVARDQRASERLLHAGWRVAVIWECGIRDRLSEVADEVGRWLTSDETTLST
jgi:DNA mismatch endonuclease (patch repair protein)